jgi:hypothetical protein
LGTILEEYAATIFRVKHGDSRLLQHPATKRHGITSKYILTTGPAASSWSDFLIHTDFI